jgi:hypothetical protein
MGKKFAPAAVVLGIFSALLLGGTGSAQASGLFECTQSGTVINCAAGLITAQINNVPVTVDVDALEGALNNINLNILSIGSIETTISNFLNPVIAPTILSGNDITVCMTPLSCG